MEYRFKNDFDNVIVFRLYDNDLWLTQRQMAELFNIGIPTVNEHLQTMGATGVIRPITQLEGGKLRTRKTLTYKLEVVVAVALRTLWDHARFLKWSTEQARALKLTRAA